MLQQADGVQSSNSAYFLARFPKKQLKRRAGANHWETPASLARGPAEHHCRFHRCQTIIFVFNLYES